MSSPFLLALLRGLIPIGVGYAVARWAAVSPEPIRAFLRFAFWPAVLFSALLGPLQTRTFLVVAGTGVAMALAGLALARLAGRYNGPSISSSAANPAVAVFALPFMAVALGGRGAILVTLGVVFAAVALTLAFADLGEKGFGVLIREPWLYAAVAALVFRLAGVPSQGVLRLVDPFVEAGWTLLLVYLGTRLHPFSGLRVGSAWAGAGIRLITGVGLALAAAALFDVSPSVRQGLLIAGLAPAVPVSLALARPGSEREDGRTTLVTSTVLALVAVVVWRLVG